MGGEPARCFIDFSGRRWWVKRASEPVGPGPNRFDDGPQTVSVRADGALVLRVRRTLGGWVCAEIVGEEPTGYGTYEWTVGDDLNALQRHVVLGLFTWSDDPDQNHREVDIEVSAWGTDDPVHGQFVVQPAGCGQVRPFTLPDQAPWRCSFEWAPRRVTFRAAGAEPWAVEGEAVPTPSGAHPRINLWLYQGVEPDDGREVALAIERFQFTSAT